LSSWSYTDEWFKTRVNLRSSKIRRRQLVSVKMPKWPEGRTLRSPYHDVTIKRLSGKPQIEGVTFAR
jgi:hypothetical protein